MSAVNHTEESSATAASKLSVRAWKVPLNGAPVVLIVGIGGGIRDGCTGEHSSSNSGPSYALASPFSI